MVSNLWIADLEGDGLEAKKLHVLSISNPSGSAKKSTPDYEDMKKFFLSADYIVMHNGQRWDRPTAERILGIKIKSKIIDTLALSWVLYPNRFNHGLEGWGEEFGVPKPKITDWDSLTYEEYEHRCSEDVEINRKLWNKMWKYLIDLYGSETKAMEYVEYLSFKMWCARLKEDSGWHVDLALAEKALKDLEDEKERKVSQLFEAMPPVPKYRTKERPKLLYKKNGDMSKLGDEWFQLLAERGLPASHEEPIQMHMGWDDPNPNSIDQVKDWLYSLGWVPKTKKTIRNKETGELREIPQINLENGKGICPSIKALFEKEPRLELLEGLGIISHRIGLFKGMITSSEDGKLKAQINGLTNTLRVKHKTIVNLPKVNKPYAEHIRAILVAPEGYLLCGADMSGLEDRLKQHFIFPFDPDYVNSMNQPDFDPHLVIAVLAGMMTQSQADDYKWQDNLTDEEKLVADKVRIDLGKSYKPIRDIAKNGNYACQYLAGVARLMITCSIGREAAQRLFDAYWKLNWAVKEVAKQQVTKIVDDQMWLKNPINGFWYSLRYEKDIFSTLVQGTASYVFDLWVQEILKVRPQLTGDFHDEIVLTVREENIKKCEELLEVAISNVNDKLKLNRELAIGIQTGVRYSQIH